jgi:hypothetical protein
LGVGVIKREKKDLTVFFFPLILQQARIRLENGESNLAYAKHSLLLIYVFVVFTTVFLYVLKNKLPLLWAICLHSQKLAPLITPPAQKTKIYVAWESEIIHPCTRWQKFC